MDKTQIKSLIAIISAISIVGATFGLTMPLITVVMKSWGESETIIGANAATPALAALLLSHHFPSLVERFGLLTFLYFCLALVIVTLLLFPLFPYTPAWFLIRFINGGAQIGLFALSETWINRMASEHLRGRVMAVYTIIFSIGVIIGALLLSIIGTSGARPFIVGACMLSIAGLPLILAGNSVPVIESSTTMKYREFLRCTPIVAIAAIVNGALYMSITSLTPAYALNYGLAEIAATRTVAWLGIGALFIPYYVGHLADHYDRIRVVFITTCLTAFFFWVLPYGFSDGWTRVALLLLLGGLINSIYSMALTISGEYYKGPRLTAAMSIMTVLYSMGEVFGPLVTGSLMDYTLNGFSYSLATICTCYVLYMLYNQFFLKNKNFNTKQ